MWYLCEILMRLATHHSIKTLTNCKLVLVVNIAGTHAQLTSNNNQSIYMYMQCVQQDRLPGVISLMLRHSLLYRITNSIGSQCVSECTV